MYKKNYEIFFKHGLFLLVLMLILFLFLRNSSPTYARLGANSPIVVFEDLLQSYGYKKAWYKARATVLFFRLLSDYITEYDYVTNRYDCKWIYSLRTIDIIASKVHMYQHLHEHLRSSQLDQVVPETYVLSNESIDSWYEPDTLYILKKNIQRQRGCLLTRNENTIRFAQNDGYLVAQRVLLDNFLVNGRKINMRHYVIILVDHDVRMYAFRNAFLYYSPSVYDPDSDLKEVHITSGLIDREIYCQNPLTMDELCQGLDTGAEVLRSNVRNLLTVVFGSFRDILKAKDGQNPQTNFVIVGADLSVDSQLNCKIMEINKGPDLGFKDERDATLKRQMVHCAFALAGICKRPKDLNNLVYSL